MSPRSVLTVCIAVTKTIIVNIAWQIWWDLAGIIILLLMQQIQTRSHVIYLLPLQIKCLVNSAYLKRFLHFSFVPDNSNSVSRYFLTVFMFSIWCFIFYSFKIRTWRRRINGLSDDIPLVFFFIGVWFLSRVSEIIGNFKFFLD